MIEKRGKGMLLIVIQLIVSALIVAGAFTVKLIGGTLHGTLGTWFYDNYNNSVMLGSKDGVFPFSDPVEVEETSTVAPGIEAAAEVKTSEAEDKKSDS